MDGLGGFLSGVFVGVLFAVISIAWSMAVDETITMKPVKDEYKNEILYYVDSRADKEYKMENNILYYKED